VRRFGRLVLVALCSVTRANGPGIQQSSFRSNRVFDRIVLFVLRGRSRGLMERALLKPEASGPEAIEPDCFGESRRDGPSKPERRVLVFSSTEIITGTMRGLSSVEWRRR